MRSTTAVDESASGIHNVWHEILKGVIVDPNLSDANDWYLFAGREAMKPLIWQVRKAPEFVPLDKYTFQFSAVSMRSIETAKYFRA